MNTDLKLTVTDVQRFCMHDGPGVRTTVFLKGCPLRCEWCHNPETQSPRPQLLFSADKCIYCSACAEICPQNAHKLSASHEIDRSLCVSCGLCAAACPTCALELCGKTMTVGEIVAAVEKDRAFYGESGGITLSGGEPFSAGETAVALLKACKEAGISTAVETCGHADTGVLLSAVPFVDLFLYDIKDTDSSRHLRYTKSDNELILRNLNAINEAAANIRLRCILVNGVNTTPIHYLKIAELAKSIKKLDKVELIPYHAYAGSKSVRLGRPDSTDHAKIPTENQIREAEQTLSAHGIAVARA